MSGSLASGRDRSQKCFHPTVHRGCTRSSLQRSHCQPALFRRGGAESRAAIEGDSESSGPDDESGSSAGLSSVLYSIETQSYSAPT